MRVLLLLAVLMLPSATDARTVNWMGKSCQICIKDGSVEVCRFFKKCPIKKKRK